jgi:hypothetical protein
MSTTAQYVLFSTLLALWLWACQRERQPSWCSRGVPSTVGSQWPREVVHIQHINSNPNMAKYVRAGGVQCRCVGASTLRYDGLGRPAGNGDETCELCLDTENSNTDVACALHSISLPAVALVPQLIP